MKKLTFISHLIYLIMLSLTLSSCGGGLSGGYGGPVATYNCDWEGEKRVYFEETAFLMPCSENCEYIFRNTLLENILNSHSIFQIMERVAHGELGDNLFDCKWTVTITRSTCTNETDQCRSLSINQDNYTEYFNQDILEHSPYNINTAPNDLKHEMIFQIHNVMNFYDGKVGTVIWKNTWYAPNVQHGDEFWFSVYNLEGDFKPGMYYSPTRNIYYNGHFQNI